MSLVFCLCALVSASSAETRRSEPLAASVVESREYVIRRAPEKEEEFIGNVRYRRGSDFVRADWALYRHETKTWEARGDVRIERGLAGGDVVEIRGARARYDAGSRKGRLVGPGGRPVELSRKPLEGEPDFGVADRLEWKDGRFHLISNVHAWGPRIEAWSDRADIDQVAGSPASVRLTGGRPVLRKLEGEWIGAVKADEIWGLEPRRLKAFGGVQGWILFSQRPKP